MSFDDLMALLAVLQKAWSDHLYILVVAIVVGGLVAASKAGWFGDWLAKVPAKARPWMALGMSCLAMVAAQVQQGVDWRKALLHGVYAAAVAVLGHQTIVEGMMSGKEPMPSAPWAKKDP